MATYSTSPLGRKQIIEYARKLRRNLGLSDILYLPVPKLLDRFSDIFSDCTVEIVETSSLPIEQHANTDIINKKIRIREDVYYGACDGVGRDRMTIMHELAHYLLLVVSKFEVTRTVATNVPSYRDPEWQAMALAAELMIPYDLTKNMPPDEIANRCGVSIQSAAYQKNHSHNKEY